MLRPYGICVIWLGDCGGGKAASYKVRSMLLVERELP